MIGSRVSARLASRQIKQEPNASLEETPKKRGAAAGTSFLKRPEAQDLTLMSSESSVEEDVDTAEEPEEEEEEVHQHQHQRQHLVEEEEDEEEEIILPTPVRRRGRISKGNKTQTDELDTARLKLNDILAHISKGDLGEDEFDDDDDHTDSALSPPHKLKRTRGPRKSRKRMREDGYQKTSSFVLKLFDRSVDLAPFSLNTTGEDVPLYPVCRAWIRNQSQPSHLDEPRRSDREDQGTDGSEKPQGIYHLPPPQHMPRDENGAEIDTRIPKSARRPHQRENKSTNIDLEMSSLEGESLNGLLNRNLTRWRATRQEWRSTAQENETRYKHSCDVLRAMYERSLSAQNMDQSNKSAETGSEVMVSM